jgi:hypothetical protein
MHSKEGAQRQKKKENWLAQQLTAHGIKYDRELSIEFNCLDSSGKRARIDFTIYKQTHTILLENDEYQHNGLPITCELRRMMDVVGAMRCSEFKTSAGSLQLNVPASSELQATGAPQLASGLSESKPSQSSESGVLALELNASEVKISDSFNPGENPDTSSCAERRYLWVRFNPDSYLVDGVKQTVPRKDRLEQLFALLDNYVPTQPVEIAYLFYDVCDAQPAVCCDPDYAAEIKPLITHCIS